ncbi:MAG: ATP-binding cassette domain-containing protein [Bdellovibrionales bacterium]
MELLLETRNLGFSYKTGPPVLKGISFGIRHGEFVAITGPSGSGKSTLFYLLGALTSKFKGDIFFEGISYRTMSAEKAAVFRNQNIGFVFQQFYLLPRANVLDNILLPANYPFETSRPTLVDQERAKNLAHELGIEHLLERGPQQLSGGQQQRVAIARALLRDPDLILADEPTGNLDSHSSEAVFGLLREMNRKGKTVVLITHSQELANQCERIIRFKDGEIEEDVKNGSKSAEGSVQESKGALEGLNLSDIAKFRMREPLAPGSRWMQFLATWSLVSYWRSLRPAIENIRRSKAKSFLTMLGVVLGIAAVLSTMSLGDFTKRRVLAGYESMGVNNLNLNGYPNWRRSSREYAPAIFQAFDWRRDLLPLQKIFTEIEAMSPVLQVWSPKFNFGGNTLSDDTTLLGVNEDYYMITNQQLKEGRRLMWLDVENAHPVCVIGSGVQKKLFRHDAALDRIVTILPQNQESEIPCRVVGVYKPQPSQNANNQPDDMIYAPYTYLQRGLTNPWERDMRGVSIKISSGFDPDKMGKQFEGYFKSRYGNTGQFNSNSNAKAIAEMRLFVAIFSSLLTAVALIALIVGGVGINNMMLVNLSERLKELGLRKALGATPQQIRALLLTESLVLCLIGGVVGLILGFCGYHGLIYAATKLIPNLEFQWVVLWGAVLLSGGAVIITGLLSGMTPALKAERLQVIDALRQE